MSAADRNMSLVSRLWWRLLPSTGFFAHPDMTTRWERAKWSVPYTLWRIVNRLPFDPFKPVAFPPCTCELCTRAREASAL